MQADKIKIEDLKFPVILFAKGNDMSFSRNISEVVICSKTGLKNGYYNQLEIVDCNGILYKIINAKKVGTVGPLWGYNIFLNQTLKVELNFEQKKVVYSLDELKKRILSVFKKEYYFWNSDGEIEFKINSVKQSETASDIIAKLTTYYYDRAKS